MEKSKIDQVGQAAANAAIAELGDDAAGVLVVVVVRPVRAGEHMNVTTNAAPGHSHHGAVGAVLGEARAAVERGATRTVEPTRRIIVPS